QSSGPCVHAGLVAPGAVGCLPTPKYARRVTGARSIPNHNHAAALVTHDVRALLQSRGRFVDPCLVADPRAVRRETLQADTLRVTIPLATPGHCHAAVGGNRNVRLILSRRRCLIHADFTTAGSSIRAKPSQEDAAGIADSAARPDNHKPSIAGNRNRRLSLS